MATGAEQRLRVGAQDLHGTVGPAEALLLEVDERVRHQPLAVAVRNVGGLQAFLEDAQAEFRVLGDAPFGPAAQVLEDRAPDHRHRAVHDDRVAFVARDHADVEETTVLGVAHRLERALVGVPVVLRCLHDGDLGIGHHGREVLQPVRRDHVVAVDDGDDPGRGIRAAQGEVERPGLEAGQRTDVEKAKARSQCRAVGLDRAPDGLILRVVVDDDYFEVRIIERRQRVQRVLDHLRRLVVAGHVHRDLRPVRARRVAGGRSDQQAAAHPHPVRLGPFVRLREQHRQDAEHAYEEQHPDKDAGEGQVLLRIVVDDPGHQRRGRVDDEREEAPAAVLQTAGMRVEPGQHRRGEDHGHAGEHLPLRGAHDRLGEFELRVALRVIDAPVGADTALDLPFPGLIEGLHDVVDVLLPLGPGEEAAQEQRLVRFRGDRVVACPAVRRPAHLADNDPLARILVLDGLQHVDRVVDRLLDGNALPVRQEVHGDEVDMVDQDRVLHPDVPGLGRADRLVDRAADPVEVLHEVDD